MSSSIRNQYSLRSKIIHWLVAFLVIALLAGGLSFKTMDPAAKKQIIHIHKSLGLTVLGLMIIRIYVMLRDGKPALPIETPLWERILARSVQYSLYLFLILMPLSGWIMSMAAGFTPKYFGLFALPFPGITPDKNFAKIMYELHGTFAYTIITLISLHILGNIKHYFWDKDKVVQKMLFCRKN